MSRDRRADHGPACIASGWDLYDEAHESDDGDVRAVLQRTNEHEITASLWPRGAQGGLQGHGSSSTWLRVISGELDEERYLPGPDGVWRYECLTLGRGATSTLPAGALHRIRARRASEVLMTFSPPPSQTTGPLDDEQREALRQARWRVMRPQRLGRKPTSR